MAKNNPDKLTFRQQCFVDEYLKDFNASQAAIRAGFSVKAASQAGNRLLSHPVVVAKIQEKRGVATTRAEVDASFVLRELKRVAEQEDVAQSTKVRALELIAKHLGMLEDRLTVKTDSLSPEQRAERVAILIERASKRGELP